MDWCGDVDELPTTAEYLSATGSMHPVADVLRREANWQHKTLRRRFAWCF
jgi:hypothetical protein